MRDLAGVYESSALELAKDRPLVKVFGRVKVEDTAAT